MNFYFLLNTINIVWCSYNNSIKYVTLIKKNIKNTLVNNGPIQE